MQLLNLREVINKYGLNPKKNLGQNFILDQNITDKIVRMARVTKGDNVIEIGPGPGGLTRSILVYEPEKLIVIEQDNRCVQALQELKNHYPQLEIFNADALKIRERDIIPVKSKIISNLPYNIGTVLLFKWLEDISYFKSLTLMFQKEVADRIVAKPSTSDYGRLSVMAQILCDCEWHFDLKPDVFFPPPKVTSSVISLYPKASLPPIDIIEAVDKICRIAFNQRRKMLRVSLKTLNCDLDLLMKDTSIKLTQRPEELSVDDFISLANNYLSI